MAESDDKRPLEYRRPSPANERYERNGWIGLAMTLAVCAVAAYLYIVRH